MTVRRLGSWKDAARRYADAAIAATLPGGKSLAPILAQVDGYLYPHEAVFLCELARSAPGTGAVVEIGSFRGRSTLCMAVGAKGRGGTRIAAVDPHVYRTEPELRENLAHFGMADVVEVVVQPSVEAARGWRGPVRVLFVDGHHQKASVEADVDAWLPHVEPGGFVVLHDSTGIGGFPGPAEVARERVVIGPTFDAVGRIGSISWGRTRGGSHAWLPSERGKLLDPGLRVLKGRRLESRP